MVSNRTSAIRAGEGWKTRFAPAPPEVVPPTTRRRARAERTFAGRLMLRTRDRLLLASATQKTRRFSESPTGLTSRDALARLRDSQAGATGVIVCNGPSINKTDLSLLGDAPYILMNRGYLLENR